MSDRMTSSDAQAMIEEVLKVERTGVAISEASSSSRMPSRLQKTTARVPVSFQFFPGKARRVGKDQYGPNAHGFYSVRMEVPGVLLVGDPVKKKANLKATYTAPMSRDGDILADTVHEWESVSGLSPLEKSLLMAAMRETPSLGWSVASDFFQREDIECDHGEELTEANSISLYQLYPDQKRFVDTMKGFGYTPTMAWRGVLGTIVEFNAPAANMGRMSKADMKKIIGSKLFRWFEVNNRGGVSIGM